MGRRLFLIGLMMLAWAISACTSSVADYNNQGNDDFAKAAYDDALEEYGAAKVEDSTLAHPYYNSGNAYHNKGDFKQAIDQTQEALRRADDDLAQQALYNLGNSYFLTEDWAAAIKAYQDALVLDPDDQNAKYNLELALKQVERQQANQNGDGQPQPSQGDQPGDSEQSQPGEGEPQGGGGEEEDEQENGPGGEEEDEDGQGDGGLTEEEAEQILDNVAQDSQTLQERLNQSFDGQGRRLPPAQDW